MNTGYIGGYVVTSMYGQALRWLNVFSWVAAIRSTHDVSELASDNETPGWI